MQQVIIKKGYWKNKPAFVAASQKEEIGNDKVYTLTDRKGKQIWNGNLTWFPESFIEFKKHC